MCILQYNKVKYLLTRKKWSILVTPDQAWWFSEYKTCHCFLQAEETIAEWSRHMWHLHRHITHKTLLPHNLDSSHLSFVCAELAAVNWKLIELKNVLHIKLEMIYMTAYRKTQKIRCHKLTIHKGSWNLAISHCSRSFPLFNPAYKLVNWTNIFGKMLPLMGCMLNAYVSAMLICHQGMGNHAMYNDLNCAHIKFEGRFPFSHIVKNSWHLQIDAKI